MIMSTRECFIALDAMHDTQEMAEWLHEQHADNAALQGLRHRLVTLWMLAQDLASNLRTGAGVPPTPSSAPRKASPPAATARRPVVITGGAPSHHNWTPRTGERSAPQPLSAIRPSNRLGRAKAITPPGHLSSSEFMAALGLSLSTFHEQRKLQRGGIPAPSIGGGPGRPAFWPRAVVEQVVAARAAAAVRGVGAA
jgi:hypothetical protein